MSIWDDIGSPEGVKTTIIQIIVGIAITICGTVCTAIAAGVGNYIIQALNRSGFTIPASANYVAPIESLLSSVFLVVRAGSSARLIIAIILAAVLDIVTVAVLWKRYGGLTA
jgi:energy-converting hydrogenase Eha subunit E